MYHFTMENKIGKRNDGSTKFNFHNNNDSNQYLDAVHFRYFPLSSAAALSRSLPPFVSESVCTLQAKPSYRWRRMPSKSFVNGRKVNESADFIMFCFIFQRRLRQFVQFNINESIECRSILFFQLHFGWLIAHTLLAHQIFYTLWTNTRILNGFHYFINWKRFIRTYSVH